MKVSDKALRDLTGYRLQRATGIAMMRYKAVFAKFGLRRTTFSCLSLIVETPGLRQSQLGETLAIERPNLVTIVEDLTKQGLIEKAVAPDDRRAYALSPTDKGRALFQSALAAVQDLDRRMTDGLKKADLAVLHTALRTMEANAANGQGD